MKRFSLRNEIRDGFKHEEELNKKLKVMSRRAQVRLGKLPENANIELRKDLDNFIKVTESALYNQLSFIDQIATLQSLVQEGNRLKLTENK